MEKLSLTSLYLSPSQRKLKIKYKYRSTHNNSKINEYGMK